MAKYKVGDKVRIVSERPKDFAYTDNMGKYLGKTFIVSMVKWHPLFGNLYSLEGAIIERGACAGSSWVFKESWISGLAEPEREPCTVELRFDGMITTAVLKRGGRDVKTAEARCNPKDTYSRAELSGCLRRSARRTSQRRASRRCGTSSLSRKRTVSMVISSIPVKS